MLCHAGLAGIAAPPQHRLLLFGEQRLQIRQCAVLPLGRHVFYTGRVQLAGRQAGALHQPLAHQQFKYPVAHKRQAQGRLLVNIHLCVHFKQHSRFPL